jgi:nucleotide-binding universal stress UspA family protein
MLELQELYVPIDFSRQSRAATKMALALAERAKAKASFVHVMPDFIGYASQTLFPYAGMGEDRVQILAELRDNAYRALVQHHSLSKVLPARSRKAPAPGEHMLEVLYTGEEQSSGAAILDRLDEAAADLVVAGFSNETLPGGLGSTVLSLVAESAQPILLVRDVPAAPIKKVMVGVDLSAHTQKVLQTALDFCLANEAELEVVVVVPEPLAVDVRGILSAAVKVDPKRLRRHARQEVIKVLDRFMGDLVVPFPFQARYEGMEIAKKVWLGDPAAVLVGKAIEGDTQVLVLGTQGERRAQLARSLGRVAHAAGANAPCHVLYVPL